MKAIKELLERRTALHTETKKAARAWILRDGVHREDGWLVRDPSRTDPVKKVG